MQTCSRCYVQSPDEAVRCVNCQSDLSEFSTTAIALKNFQSNPRVQLVRIEVMHDCCPACREISGAYAKEQAPKLPVEACSHAHGCRCFYQPVLEEIYP